MKARDLTLLGIIKQAVDDNKAGDEESVAKLLDVAYCIVCDNTSYNMFDDIDRTHKLDQQDRIDRIKPDPIEQKPIETDPDRCQRIDNMKELLKNGLRQD